MNLGYPAPKQVFVYFHFRSPYCYLASKNLWPIVDEFHTELVWRPLGGWDGRSPPERAKVKVPLARQDLARQCRRMGIPCVPPPITTAISAPFSRTAATSAARRLRNKGSMP